MVKSGMPVVGRPRRFRCTFIGLAMFLFYFFKSKPRGSAEPSAPALTRTKVHIQWLKLTKEYHGSE